MLPGAKSRETPSCSTCRWAIFPSSPAHTVKTTIKQLLTTEKLKPFIPELISVIWRLTVFLLFNFFVTIYVSLFIHIAFISIGVLTYPAPAKLVWQPLLHPPCLCGTGTPAARCSLWPGIQKPWRGFFFFGVNDTYQKCMIKISAIFSE